MTIKEENKKLLELAAITNFPSPTSPSAIKVEAETKIAHIAHHFREIMIALGLDIEDESLARTPYRVAKMYVNEIFSGLEPSNFPEIRFVEDHYEHEGKSNMVFLKVNFNSFCEHHFVPMMGTAYVAYMPNKKLIGLSKIPRIVRYFAHRPQLQERLSAQIADCLSILLGTESVAVSLVAQHYCMIARGIEDTTSHALTNVFRGEFDSNDNLRKEFLEAINRDK